MKGIVNYLEQYNIPFSGLKPGSYTFDFHIDGKFFELFEQSEIKEGNVAVEVIMDKEERLFDLHFKLKGRVIVPCDRCLEDIPVEIEGSQRLLVKIGDKYLEESEEVQVIPDSDHKIELGSFLYEYIVLMLPARRVHPDDENGESMCNPEVIRKLNELNEHHEPDLRWDILNKLKDDKS